MKDARIIAAIPTKAENCVLKNNGIFEKFSHEKILKSCLMAGAPLWAAEKIASQAAGASYDGVTTKEIKMWVYDSLKRVEPAVADKYLRSNQLRVRTARDTIESFDKSKIEKTLIVETGASPEIADKIATSVWKEVRKLDVEYLTAPMLREMVNTKLVENGLETLRRRYTRLGIPVYKADAHLGGDIHIHDLEFFAGRPVNCLQHDLRFFIKNGLKVDGTGDHTSVPGPPNHIETLMTHSGEIMLAAQQNMSGGQSMSLWNVFVAPFAHGLPYEKVKQAVQMFIYNLNMAYAARGSQVPFTSINLEFTVPDFLKEEPAYGPKGRLVGTYGDFEDETRMLQRAFTEVLLEGDSDGKPHLFPNTIYALRKEVLKDEFTEDLELVHELSSKYGTAYFTNMLPSYRGQMANYMGCRTSLSDNWTGDWDKDCFRTGNLAYITLNLPRIAYQSKDEDEIFEYLDSYLRLSEEVLMLRRKQAVACLDDYNLLPFLTQELNDERYYRVENSTMSFGFVGLNEMLQSFCGSGIDDPDSLKLGLKVIDYMNGRAQELKKDTGLRWTILQTPAESTAYRFATLDREKFGNNAITQGDSEAYYYTNSSHLPVDTSLNLAEKIRIEEQFHSRTLGGHIFHAFMGESHSDPEALMSLTNKIARKSDIGFWAYSSALSFCIKCKTLMKGLQDNCASCGEQKEVEWYDRITGYVQQVGRSKSASGGWNPGKMKELMDRKRY
ncbi:MAG: anaerobic ribonucleoside-triphosphate reductase [Methanobacterium sp.]|nr:anaerobic ribonucleoside-triphosphate reductase [Methanobacterium sp.]